MNRRVFRVRREYRCVCSHYTANLVKSDVNAYLREITGEEFTAKDFRTWAGTVLAALALREFKAFDSQAEAKRNIVRAIHSITRRSGFGQNRSPDFKSMSSHAFPSPVFGIPGNVCLHPLCQGTPKKREKSRWRGRNEAQSSQQL